MELTLVEVLNKIYSGNAHTSNSLNSPLWRITFFLKLHI